MRLALFVDVTEIRLPVQSVVALAGEDKPAACMRPAVLSVALLTVYDAEAVCLACL